MGLSRDPRHYQIAVLASLLAYGLFYLDFQIPLTIAAIILGTARGVQYACSNIWKIPRQILSPGTARRHFRRLRIGANQQTHLQILVGIRMFAPF